MFMCSPILCNVSYDVSPRGYNTYIRKSANGFVDIAGRVFIKLFVIAKDDNSNVDRAED